jgi:hypothetical protein
MLLTMLPPKPTAAPWDLSKLDDVVLDALGRILCKIEGVPFPADGTSWPLDGHGSPAFIGRCDCALCQPRT